MKTMCCPCCGEELTPEDRLSVIKETLQKMISNILHNRITNVDIGMTIESVINIADLEEERTLN